MNRRAKQDDGASTEPCRPAPSPRHRVDIFHVDLPGRARYVDADVQLGCRVRREILIFELFAISTDDVVGIEAHFARICAKKSAGVQSAGQRFHVAPLDRLQGVDAAFCETGQFRKSDTALFSRLSQLGAKLQLLVGHRVAARRKRDTTESQTPRDGR